MAAVPLPKPKTCRVCKAKYQPPPGLRPRVCSVPCAIELGKRQREQAAKRAKRQERRERKAKLEKLMTVRDWTKVAQRAFNEFVRTRDEGKPCICCGRYTSDDDLITGSRWDAGHYRSTGAAPHLRFHEDNCHRQLVHCNRDRSGNAVDYRIGLIERIGIERVEALENDNAVKRWTIEQLQAIAKTYRAKTRELRKARGA